MDILKLLSRSTKHANKLQSTKEVTTSLPSAGTRANPQLFNDAIPESRGKKRKRGEKKTETKSADDDDEAINFFEPKEKDLKLEKAVNHDATSNKAKSEKSKPKNDSVTTNTPFLEEEECRQILRSHRLKVTLLSTGKAAKEVKKSKKRKVTKKSSTKEEYKRLYSQPLMAFSDLKSQYGISGRMAQNLMEQGYKIPTEVQMGALPLLLQPNTALGKSLQQLGDSNTDCKVDLLAVAPTGSGKTLAFLIPAVNQIIQRRRTSSDKSAHILEAIVVAPTKELANQIVNEVKKLSLGTGVKVIGMRKGLKIVEGSMTTDPDVKSGSDSEGEEDASDTGAQNTKKSQHAAKADILITTPGLLLSSLSTTDPETHLPLPSVQTLILDEADILLDPLFRDQTLGIWNACTNPSLRVTLWSATMGSNIEVLAASTISARRSKLKIKDNSQVIRLVVGLKDSAIPNISHKLVYAATEPGKLIALRQLLHPTAKSTDSTQSLRPPFLVFTQTIPRAIALHSELLYDIPVEAGGSSRIAVLHSSLSDSARDAVMTGFRNGEIWILITTDILSRGVDFRGINGVVNYDVPNSGASYIHRVGRTGRAGREGGVAVTFYTKEDIPYVKNIANIIAASEKAAGKEGGDASIQKWFLDSLPKPSKEEKKRLKMHGVEARRGGLGEGEGKGKGHAKMRIGTKSGYERKLENRRKGAIEGSKRRANEVDDEEHDEEEESEWVGIDE